MAEFDELNNLEASVEDLVQNVDSIKDEPNRAIMQSQIEDDLEDLLIMAYVMGSDYAKRVLDIEDEEAESVDRMSSVINQPIEGKTWKERVREHAQNGDFGMIETVIRTEADRVYNEAVEQTAEESEIPNIYKTWVTMDDEKVRDTHWHLRGMTVPLNDYFYTFNYDRAKAPHGFGVASEDCNCRCRLRLTKKK